MLKKYRRKGLAIALLKELFKQKQGKYLIVELAKNKPAISFWKNIYSELNYHIASLAHIENENRQIKFRSAYPFLHANEKLSSYHLFLYAKLRVLML